jgi:mannosyltransferase OCH1-like enzyme
MSVPKIIHQIWFGDKNMLPYNLVNTWKQLNPSWEHILWTEENIFPLVNQKQFDSLGNKFNGKADLARYEILHEHGGFFIDIDTKALRPLTDEITQTSIFACYENEKIFPEKISNGYIGCVPKHWFIEKIITEINSFEPSLVENISPWRIIGPNLLTGLYKTTSKIHNEMTIFPSWYFIPKHYSGVNYTGSGLPYCEQYWGTTLNAYSNIKQIL